MQWEVGSEFGLQDGCLTPMTECDLSSVQSWRLPPGECRLVQNGRAALLTVLRDARCQGRLADAWLPSYLCASMVQPFQQSGLQVHYYPVDNHLVPVEGPWDQVAGRESAVLYVNFFGLPLGETVQTIAQQQRDRGVVTILDITHSLFNATPNEVPACRYAVASLRKWAGLPDGGLVWKGGSGFLTPAGVDLSDGGFGRARLVAGLMKGLYHDGILSQKDGYRALFRMAEDIADGCAAAVPMSQISRTIWVQLNAATIMSTRRANYAVLASGISRLRSLRVLQDRLPEHVCPLGCPIVSPSRDDLRMYLTSHSVFCPIHWRLSPEIETAFPTSQSVSTTILTLPCDQRYTTSDMEQIVTLLTKWDNGHLHHRDENVV